MILLLQYAVDTQYVHYMGRYVVNSKFQIISRFGLREAGVEGDTDCGNRGLDFSHLLAAFLRVGSGEASGAGGGHSR